MAEKIPVIDVLKQSLTLLRDNVVAAVILFIGPALLYGVQMAFLTPPVDHAHPQVNWLGSGVGILDMLILLPSLTAWYRRAIFGLPAGGGLGWRLGRAEWLILLAFLKIFGWCVLGGAVIGGVLGGLAFGVAMLAHLSSDWVQIMAVSIVAIAAVILVLWTLPLALTFPAAALGTALSRKQAFALAAGNRWRLLLLIGVVPIGVGLLAHFIAKLPLEPLLVAVLLAAATVLSWSVSHTLLALCYRHLAGPPATADNAAGAASPELG